LVIYKNYTEMHGKKNIKLKKLIFPFSIIFHINAACVHAVDYIRQIYDFSCLFK